MNMTILLHLNCLVCLQWIQCFFHNMVIFSPCLTGVFFFLWPHMLREVPCLGLLLYMSLRTIFNAFSIPCSWRTYNLKPNEKNRWRLVFVKKIKWYLSSKGMEWTGNKVLFSSMLLASDLICMAFWRFPLKNLWVDKKICSVH